MRTKKAIINAVISILYQLVAVVCGLITPRLILATFGSTYNGVISSANQFLELISVLTLGIAGATRVALYKPIAVNDKTAISRIVKANKQYMHKVGMAIIAYSIVLCIIYPFISHNDLSHVESAALIAIVSVGVFAQYFFGMSNQTLLSADQSGYIYYLVQLIATVFNTIIAVVLIKLGCSIFVVKLGSAVVFFLSPFVLNIIVKKKYDLDDKCEPDPTAIKGRGAVAFHSIANIIHDNTDLVILTLFTDAKLISVYTVYMLVVGKVRRILLMLTNGLEGAFGNMWAKKEIAAFENNFRFFEFLIFSSTSVVFSTVGILIIPFIRLYTSGVTDINYILFDFAILLTITETMYCIRHPYLIIVQATGNYEATKKGAAAEAVINIVTSVVLVQFMGLNGVIIGTLIANTFRTVQYAFFISNHVIKGSIKGSIGKFVWFLTNSIAILAVDYIIGRFISISGWLGWIIQGIIYTSLGLAITAIMSFLFYRSEFERLKSMPRRFLRKK